MRACMGRCSWSPGGGILGISLRPKGLGRSFDCIVERPLGSLVCETAPQPQRVRFWRQTERRIQHESAVHVALFVWRQAPASAGWKLPDYFLRSVSDWMIRWLVSKLAPWGGRVPMRVDWFAAPG